jgi:hypothetical protein
MQATQKNLMIPEATAITSKDTNTIGGSYCRNTPATHGMSGNQRARHGHRK